MARGDCNITNICIPTRRIIYSAGFTPPAPPPPPECNFPEGSFAQGGEICDWGYRVRYDVDPAQVPSDQTSYPLSVDFREIVNDLTPADAATFWNEISRDSIRVTLVDGTTEIPHYTHAIDNINETGRLTALVPTLSSIVATSIFIYFANPLATEYAVGNALGRNITFASFAFYGDMEQNPAGAAPQLTDLTGNTNDYTTQGTMLSGDRVAGKVGSWWQFDGTDDAATTSDPSFKNDTTGTLAMWVKVNSIFGADGVLGYFSIGGAAQANPALWFAGKRRIVSVGTDTFWSLSNRRGGNVSVRGLSATTTPLAAGATYLFVIRSNGTSWSVNVNNLAQTITLWGTSGGVNNGDWFGDINPAGTPVSAIGNNYTNGAVATNWSDDDIGPIMLRSVVASDDLLTTEYNNQNAPGTFATFTNFLANTS